MQFLRISSTVNRRVKEAVRIRERNSTQAQSLLVIEGRRVIETALAAGARINEVFFTDRFHDTEEGRAILSSLPQKGLKAYAVSEIVLNKITDTETPQGIAAVVSYDLFSLNKIEPARNPLFVVADGIQEPGNLGTIIRTADAAGVSAVIILEGTCDVFMPKVIRATAGSIFHIPIARAETKSLVRWLQEKHIKLAMTSADADNSIFDAKLEMPLAFVFGNEAHGVSEEIKKSANMSLKVPIYGKAESLNVATSAAICLYEAARQLRAKPPTNPHHS